MGKERRGLKKNLTKRTFRKSLGFRCIKIGKHSGKGKQG